MPIIQQTQVRVVYLMRHGRTAHNVSDRLRGRNDLELDQEGYAQADALGELFADQPITRVMASPLQRARYTARPMAAKLGLSVEPIEGLNDRDYGKWTGVERAQVVAQFGSIDAAPGVETWDDLSRRVVAAFNAELARSAGCIALVGHDASNRALLGAIFPEQASSPTAIPQANGCWNRLDLGDKGWTLTTLNALPGDGQLP